MASIGRNDACPCGSGKKYKKCCLNSAAELPDLLPAELVEARVAAFGRKDFGFIFDTYHPDSGFRSHFCDRGAYIQQGLTELSVDYRIAGHQIVRERTVAEDEVEVIFMLETATSAGVERCFECSRFLRHNDHWLYHSSVKIAAEDVGVAVDEVDFIHFDQARDKVWY